MTLCYIHAVAEQDVSLLYYYQMYLQNYKHNSKQMVILQCDNNHLSQQYGIISGT